MKSILRSWKARWQARTKAFNDANLAQLSASQREEIDAFHRWWREHQWRNYGVLLLVWVASSLVLHWVNPTFPLFPCFLISGLLIGLVIFASMTAWFGFHKFPGSLRMIVIVVVLAGVNGVLGLGFGAALKGGLDGAWDTVQRLGPTALWAGTMAGAIYAVLVTSIVHFRRRQFETRNRELAADADRERLARQLADARLRLLQAQVEPHFLFNTLGSVQQLAEGRAPEAAHLTSDLITFLRAGLTSLREETSTLAREFEMADAYLNIMKVRMGSRLSAHVVLPAELAGQSIPPAMLISLVENAIKHGVEPAVEGGEIIVRARRVEDQLIISVADTGLGLRNASVSGDRVGLANIRERLAALFGEHARLDIQANAPRGAVATITLPIQAGSPNTSAGAMQ